MSGIAGPFAAAAVATGATTGAALWASGGSALAGDAGADDAVTEAATEADGADEAALAGVVVGEEGAGVEDTGEEGPGEEDTGEGGPIAEDWGVPGGEAAAAFCRAIEPVTVSRPCSRTLMREYSRSRSPLRVSMADASRRVSFWLSFAIDWICCDCRARSALAICSRRHPIAD